MFDEFEQHKHPQKLGILIAVAIIGLCVFCATVGGCFKETPQEKAARLAEDAEHAKLPQWELVGGSRYQELYRIIDKETNVACFSTGSRKYDVPNCVLLPKDSNSTNPFENH